MRNILLCLLLFSCTNEKEPVKYRLTVGGTYKICGPNNNNPFEKQAKATVVITDMKKGYVQYCWDYEYNKRDRTLFNRSEKEFIQQIMECNK